MFTETAWGEIVEAPEGFAAFVPADAPRTLELTPPAIDLLDEASNALGILAGIGRLVRNPQLLISPYLRREAVLSSRIEGTQTTMSDLYADELDQGQLVRAADVREVRNYMAAHQHGLRLLDELPLSLRFIRQLHRRLMRGVRGRERHPGSFRTYQNWIGAAAGEDATYVGPPVDRMVERLDDFERFMHTRTLRPLVQAAVLHYQFEAIHPFGDGNGRVGRLLTALFLQERGLLPQPLLYLSAYFERSRSDYYDGLLRVSTHGDWDRWIRYFLRGVKVQADEAAELSDRLIALHSRYRDDLQAEHVTVNVLAMVDVLFENPLANAASVQQALNVSAPTARKVLRTLEERGMVTEISGRDWGKVYSASEIHDVLRGEEHS